MESFTKDFEKMTKVARTVINTKDLWVSEAISEAASIPFEEFTATVIILYSIDAV